ncbi:dihydrofolate reductase [Candidatus Pacearchaeota archaeon]|nr:dihydrofolate reductase [Candidatus Pacearchaeota archaeon]
MTLTLIAAVADKNVIGYKGTIPWRQTKADRQFYKEDMERFRQLTIGHPVIMGRKTWDSFAEKYKPLPERINIIVTRDKNFSIGKINSSESVIVVHSIEEALKHEEGPSGRFSSNLFVIGGQQIYEQTIGIANAIELTRIHEEFEGDAFFPEIRENAWNVRKTQPRDGYTFFSYERKNDENLKKSI